MSFPLASACLAAALVLVASSAASLAQAPTTCTSVALRDPPRTAIRCPGGLVFEVEAASALRISAPASGGPPTSAEIEGRAALIDLRTRRSFQIRTPHAIASVRGTVYAVDVTPKATAVFVVEGEVEVARRRGTGRVTLGPGEGVDVVPGEALTVRRWPEPRVRALLSRFGL